MTTAEMMFSPVGELATERREEAHKIFWALLAALVIHFIIGCALAMLGGVRSAPAPVEDAPMELNLVDTAPAVPQPKNTMFMETDESRQSVEPPKEKTFESNANSIAASQVPPTGEAPLPSQEGKDRPALDLENQNYSLASKGAQAQPSAAPKESVQPSQAPTAAPTPKGEELAMLTTKPTPPPQAPATPEPQRPASAYRPQRQQTRISGSISNRGISSVNALGTPLGRYEKILKDSIGSRWYAYIQPKLDLVKIGTVQAHFFIDRSGKIKNLKIIENTSNETFANICLQSILESNLPPIPDDVASTLPSEGLEIEGMNFIIYPN